MPFGKKIDGPIGRRRVLREEVILAGTARSLRSSRPVVIADVSPTGAKLQGRDFANLDGDVLIKPGTFACIAQVFDAKHGPMQMIFAHPDGRVTMRDRDLIMTHAVGNWWNLQMTNDTKEGGKVRIYANDVLVGTYDSRGPRDYYFKCGVYSRNDSDKSEVFYRNIKMWVKQEPGK